MKITCNCDCDCSKEVFLRGETCNDCDDGIHWNGITKKYEKYDD